MLNLRRIRRVSAHNTINKEYPNLAIKMTYNTRNLQFPRIKAPLPTPPLPPPLRQLIKPSRRKTLPPRGRETFTARVRRTVNGLILTVLTRQLLHTETAIDRRSISARRGLQRGANRASLCVKSFLVRDVVGRWLGRVIGREIDGVSDDDWLGIFFFFFF